MTTVQPAERGIHSAPPASRHRAGRTEVRAPIRVRGRRSAEFIPLPHSGASPSAAGT